MVHGIDAVRGDVHLEQRAVVRAEVEDAFDRDAAQRQIFGELLIGDVEGQASKSAARR